MKILAMEKEVSGVRDDAYEPHLKAEATRAWELVQAGVIREIYFRADEPSAVMILECPDLEEAERMLGTLPLVREHLIAFDLIPLRPYPGFGRLFAEPVTE